MTFPHHSRFHLPLALLLLAFAGPARAEDLTTTLPALKTAPSTKAIFEQLRAVGFSRELLDQAAALKGSDDEPVVTPANLKRAETWSVNMDADEDKESVVQVWLQTPAPNMAFDAAYLILVLDAPGAGGKPLWEHLYDLGGCTYSSEKTMSLAFRPARGKPYKEIHFAIDEATSCGTLVEITSHKEVLAYSAKTGRLELVAGKGKTSGVDRMEHLRE